MVSVGITGHRHLSRRAERAIRDEIRAVLLPLDDVVVVSSLADGADQIAAEVALELGGRLESIVPAAGYRDSLEPRGARRFDQLIARSSQVQTLDFDAPAPDAYLAAGVEILRRVSLLLAVWDGEEARGVGGTAEIVELARQRGVAVHVVWPDGERRP